MDVLVRKRGQRLDPTSEYFVREELLEIVRVKGMTNGLKKLDDERTLVPTLIRNVSLARKMQTRPDDTFVIGYPKSGRF
jgi:hypothetical protein